MKKFIVTFSYNGFLFTAKVFIHKHGNTIVYSTQISENGLGYMFTNKELIFSKEPEGYTLMLFTSPTRRKNQSCEMVDWHINTEFIDTMQTLHTNTFSMS